jgi:mannose-6-phosphate isomerase
MSELYPLLMKPLFDPRPWGTYDLAPIYEQKFNEKIGESWLTGDNCKVQNGVLAGTSLSELAVQYKRELVGDAPAEANLFPLLAKFLFPHEKLSVQVHPDDDAARAIGQPCGKTECWYVAHAEPGAEIGLGLKDGVTREQFARSIQDNRAEDLLNWINVKAGDMIYVAGGTVHTLGPGSIIVETQQQSDTTFRLYDYGRPRELHLQDGLRVIKEKVTSGKVNKKPGQEIGENGNRLQPLVTSLYFTVERFDLQEAQEFDLRSVEKSSVQILVATEGQAFLETPSSEPVKFSKGDGIVVPAGIQKFTIRPERCVQFLKSYVPGAGNSEPETSLG